MFSWCTVFVEMTSPVFLVLNHSLPPPDGAPPMVTSPPGWIFLVAQLVRILRVPSHCPFMAPIAASASALLTKDMKPYPLWTKVCGSFIILVSLFNERKRQLLATYWPLRSERFYVRDFAVWRESVAQCLLIDIGRQIADEDVVVLWKNKLLFKQVFKKTRRKETTINSNKWQKKSKLSLLLESSLAWWPPEVVAQLTFISFLFAVTIGLDLWA